MGAGQRGDGAAVGQLERACARWQARLDGAELPPRGRRGNAAFVSAVLPAAHGGVVRVEVPGLCGAVVVHWPVTHPRELACWLREMRG